MTNERDDDDVLGIDLDAWQPPPPPAHIADGVIARMRQETTSVTVQALPVEAQRAPIKRTWIIIASGVALAATTTIAVFAATRGPADASGSVAAARPTHVSMGPSSAEVDANTPIRWKREGYRITARQAAGTATWRVDEDDTLTIETALGSIEATNASLRVEVKMRDDKKTIALSAVTAAAVAAVTIVVYHGVVKTSDGTTVAAGTAYQIKAEGENVIEEEAHLAAAASEMNAKIGALEAELAEKLALIEALQLQQQRTVDPFDANVPVNVDRITISRVMRGLAEKARTCAKGFNGKLAASVRVRPDGSVENVTMIPADAKPGACIADVIRTADFGKTMSGGSFKYPFVFAGSRTSGGDLVANPFSKACDAEALTQKGRDLFSTGNPAAALVQFEAALRCKADPSTLRLVLASACKSKNFTKAHFYWHKMTPQQRDPLASICVMSGITPEQLDGVGTGRLKIINSVPATVLLDGAEIGTTPVDLDVPAGRHKVTLVVGADKHTFAVDVKVGGTLTMSKTLE